MQPGLKKFIQSWLINTFAVLVTVYIVPGMHFEDKSFLTPFITALVLGILNTFIRPIMMLLALPLLIFTLGLFVLVINAMLLLLVSWLLPQFRVDSFGWALLGAVIISVVSMALNSLTGTGGSRITIQRHRRPPDDQDKGGGGGPVIDV